MTEARQIAVDTLKLESEAIAELIPLLNADFDRAVEQIYLSKGRLIITGVGKSGHIGAKIAATLASTGTPSFFVNPLDAFHGDLGMITAEDIVLAISYSGKTDELLRFIPYLLERKIPLIGMTGNPDSLLARYSTYHLNIAVKREACPLNLAPTSSTTATLAMGDALACALMWKRDFKPKDFARFHPGGTLGKRLLTKVKDVMHKTDLPIVSKDASVEEMLAVITKGRQGIVIIVENHKVLGLITNGDLRRAIQQKRNVFFSLQMRDLMNSFPVCVNENDFLSQADDVFKEKKLNTLLVLDDQKNFVGILNINEI